MELKLKSGFSFDYTNLVGEGRVTEAELKELAPRLKAAHAAVQQMRATGEVRGHLSKDGTPEKVLFSTLPYVKEGNLNSPASLARLAQFSAEVQEKVDVVVSLGIGGSFLGNKVLFDVHCGEFWNSLTEEERKGYPEVYFSGQNIDARRTADLIRLLAHKAKLSASHKKRPLTVLLLVISKSGGTLDTMSNFMVIYEALAKIKNINRRVVAVTDPNEAQPTLLKKLATEKGWPTFAVPDGVGGRFSVFCEVGLSLAAAIGFDIESFLAGARAMDQACQTDRWKKILPC